MENQPLPNNPSPPPNRPRRVWMWVLIGLVVVLGIPAVACGAFGLAVVAASRQPMQASGFGPAVGVIDIEGQIYAGEAGGLGGTVAGSDTIIDLIDRAEDDPNIQAIVVQINSPGGGVVASDEITRRLTELEKPVVVSMGTTAASGGYMIATAADYIYATPYTLTGSIGVISQFVTAEELLNDLGVEIVVVTAGDVKDFGSVSRDMTEAEREYWQGLIDEIHQGFIAQVAEGRNMALEDVQAVADGRVVLGEQAAELGLVDAVGYYDDAVAMAAQLGGIEGEPRIIDLEPEIGLFDTVYGLQSSLQPATAVDALLRSLNPPSLDALYLAP